MEQKCSLHSTNNFDLPFLFNSFKNRFWELLWWFNFSRRYFKLLKSIDCEFQLQFELNIPLLTTTFLDYNDYVAHKKYALPSLFNEVTISFENCIHQKFNGRTTIFFTTNFIKTSSSFFSALVCLIIISGRGYFSFGLKGTSVLNFWSMKFFSK